MIKFKVFIGTLNHPADEAANQWMAEHPNVKIVNMSHSMGRFGDHSLCIMYEEY